MSLVQVPDLQGEPLNTSGAVGLSGMQEKILYENPTYGFMITYPNDWTMKEAGPNSMGLVAGFLPPGEYMDNPMDYVTVQIEDLPPEQKITLGEYTGSIFDNLESTYQDFQILSEGDMIMSGEPAHVIAYSATDEQTPYQIMLAKEMINSFELAWYLTF